MGGGAGTSARPVTSAAVIRPATADDIAAILGIERASFGDPWTEKSFRGLLPRPEVLTRVVERAGEVLGYSVTFTAADEAEIANLAVAPAARRQQLGAALLDDLLATLRARGVAVTYLEVREGNAAAQALYASRGFESVGRRTGYYTTPVEDAVVMRRTEAQ